MAKAKVQDLTTAEGNTKKKSFFSDFPKCIICILGNEFCERFSFYGMKAILVLYLSRALKYDDNASTAIYHAFSFVCYFLPLFGALLSDGWIGKYKTIVILSVVYCIGNVFMSVTAIPFGGYYNKWTPFISLLLIAIGTGGIKPCVSAFGGDQFEEHQVRQKEAFFSIFYISINVGSLLSTMLTPMLKSEVFCFGDNCYTLAFGVPAALMVIALISFIAGTRWYKIVETKENTIGKMIGCIGTAIRGKCSCRKNPDEGPKDHWLDHAEGHYPKAFVSDVKCVLQVMYLFLPFPIFWALFDQQGSRWTLQSAQMNGDFGSFVLQPDMIQVFNPIMIVIFVPVLETIVFPCLKKLHIPNSPLQRLGFGMFLAGTAFIVAAGIQMVVDKSMPAPLDAGMSRIRFTNAAPYALKFNFENTDYTVGKKQMSDFLDIKFGSYNVTVEYDGGQLKTFPMSFDTSVGYQMVFAEMKGALTLGAFQQHQLKRTGKGKSTAWIINTLRTEIDVDLKNDRGHAVPLLGISPMGNSSQELLAQGEYHVLVKSTNMTLLNDHIISKTGAVYTIVIQYEGSNVVAVKHEDVDPNSVNIFWQVPQYIVMTIGECFFSVTGLSFAYSQAPTSMKSVLQAAFLLTTAFGNLIVFIVSMVGRLPNQTAEFLLFAGLMYVTLVIYVLMSLSYKYKEEGQTVVDDDYDDDAKPGNVDSVKTLDETDEKPIRNGTANDSAGKAAGGDGTYENVELRAAPTDTEPNVDGKVNTAFDTGVETSKL